MKKSIKTVAILLVSLGSTTSHAQQIANTSGSTFSGSGGTSTFSIGQVVYTTYTGSNGTCSQGVQQPYEISIVSGLDETKEVTLKMNVYPNPTIDFLSLNLFDLDFSTLNYQLKDITGKLISGKKIDSSIEVISMENIPNAIYYLIVINNNDAILKTFKIIKN